MTTIKAVMQNIFSPTPVYVSLPRKFKVADGNTGEQIDAYKILVEYKSGKLKEFAFPVNNDKSRAYMCALKFYCRQKERVAAYKRLHRNENTK